MKIRRVADGKEFEGPDGAKLPDGFEVVTAAPKYDKSKDPFAAGIGSYIAGNVKRHPENVIAAGASLIPGAGLLPALARPAAAAGVTGLVTGDPVKSAIAATEVAGGQVLGGAARGAARMGKAALDTTADLTMKAIGKAVPAFEGKTAAEVINRIIGGDGLKAVSKEYGAGFRALVKRITGEEFKGTEVPDSARQLMRQMAPNEMAALDAMYAKAQTISEWVTQAFKGGLMPAKGKIAAAPLQEALLDRRAAVRQALPDVEQLLRMPVESSARDVAGTGLLKSFGGHVTPFGGIGAYFKKMPGAPQMAQEGMTPELAAQAARLLGTVGAGQVLAPGEK